MARTGQRATKTEGKVTTWKLRIETRPGQRHLPAQRIHLDICAIPSHEPRPMMLRNLCGIEIGTSGLLLQAQSRDDVLSEMQRFLPVSTIHYPQHPRPTRLVELPLHCIRPHHKAQFRNLQSSREYVAIQITWHYAYNLPDES